MKKLIAAFRNELQVLRLLLGHPDTPRASRWLLGAAIAYAASPVDLIPDFIPGLGQLDDLLVLPLLVWAGLRLVPAHLVRECRAQVSARAGQRGAAADGARHDFGGGRARVGEAGPGQGQAAQRARRPDAAAGPHARR